MHLVWNCNKAIESFVISFFLHEFKLQMNQVYQIRELLDIWIVVEEGVKYAYVVNGIFTLAYYIHEE